MLAATLLLVITVPSLAVPAEETTRCTSAIYYYGVVSTRVVCTGDQAEGGPGETRCKKSAVNQLCHDGTNPESYNCDPVVDVYRAADYYNSSIKKETKDRGLYRGYGVPWVLQSQRNPSFYYKARVSARVQYLYKVDDMGVGPDNCANLVIKLRDMDGPKNIDEIWNQQRITEYTEMTEWQKIKLPLPTIAGSGPSQFHLFTSLVDTLVPDVKVEVTYVLMFEKMHLENGSKRHLSVPGQMRREAMKMLRGYEGMKGLRDVQIGTHTLICYGIRIVIRDFSIEIGLRKWECI